MRTLVTGLALAIFSSAAFAQVPGLSNAEVEDRTSISNPAEAVSNTGSGWIAMKFPANEGTRSPCCWKGNWTSRREIGCRLDKDFNSYGTTSESPLEEHIIVYARVENDRVNELRVLGEQCPMDGKHQTVTWIGQTDDGDAMAWLENLAENGGERVSHSALWVMALHDSDEAIERLLDIARNSHDPEQRNMAMFWLAQEQPGEARELLKDVVETESDEEILDQAIFAISLLPPEDSGPMLLNLASNGDAPRHARRQALFWLAQSADDETLAQLTEILTR